MKNTGRMRIENETTLVFNEEEAHAVVWSCSAVFERKMEALGLIGEEWGPAGKRWQIPKGWIRVRKPRELNEDQKLKLKESGIRLSLSRRPHS